jgi:hypothetical protein
MDNQTYDKYLILGTLITQGKHLNKRFLICSDIDERELAEALKQMGEVHDRATVREMIKMYDVDGNGKIDFYGKLLECHF